MSGENLQTFVTKYKPEDAEKLTLRMKNGLGSSKYKPTEYERLQAIVDAKRLESELIGQKVQKTRCAAKATKESSLLRQHRQVWSRERPRLQKAEEQAEDELHHFLEQIRPIGITDTAIFSLQEYELSLKMEQEAFRKDTVDPVHQLRDDLRFRLSNVQLSKLSSNFEQVTQQINFVKDQQDDILAKLHAEYLDVEKEILGIGLEKYLISASVNSESLPKEVLDADCPYPELKDSLIQAFQSLSERYQSRLQSLQEQLQKTDRFCGWCPEDHEHFQLTVSMYTHDTPNHRALCMDMLLRRFPERTRLELMEHERLWDWQRSTQAQMKAVTQRWHRDLEELLARALVMLQEAEHAHKEELEHHRERQHQQDICLRLREKLEQWRTQQEEVAKLEAAIAARRQEDEEGRMKREQEREAAVRSQKREKVRQFHLKQQRRREVLERRDQERLAALRGVMDEQARRDRQRVQFRADMLQRQREDREARELEQQREEQERQNRLEALRKQVEVQAEADPERMMADTEAWRSRLVNEKQFELQRPLYSLNTYTDTQIVSDPRVRAERALREAGLHQNQYAKEVLSDIKPPRPPRRDTKSTIKF
ncbi:coiled-coil domain-containing protein 148 [Kryptolebias marmoratus]|uniref:coiled-coil domain-containing protein 148 n=1 Tax=Kryptolebias marmoratus TaxID=37003 RepID=UPI0007F8B7A2|nr:coiled-coil domain-containing protein 148 [Kryptolebias marmoratus]XP_017279987.1 coiled-coil domain-containing protein 148 [Kryptolebias marmoratus]